MQWKNPNWKPVFHKNNMLQKLLIMLNNLITFNVIFLFGVKNNSEFVNDANGLLYEHHVLTIACFSGFILIIGRVCFLAVNYTFVDFEVSMTFISTCATHVRGDDTISTMKRGITCWRKNSKIHYKVDIISLSKWFASCTLFIT